MKIKSAKSFRFWYKTKEKQIEKDNLNYNENFIGTYHTENGKKIKGFFEMYHGDKPDIAGYLPSILKIAEDGQAIYEFLQNAVDCESTHFYIFYNEKYFLAINNGVPFETDGLKSILNIAQSTKKDADKIGRFGIGFKLAHRLVGKNEGAEELTQQYKGPILFSWSKLEDLQDLMNKEKIETIFPSKNNSDFFTSPYLLKLVLTNFPTEPNEIVKDLKYKDRILFPQEELDELSYFLKQNFEQHSESLNFRHLKQGSLFFIKLGEGKKAVLDRDYDELVNGIQYSMNMLKNLKEVYINENHIDKIRLWLDRGRIPKESETFQQISPEYKEFDIQFSVGYPYINFGNANAFDSFKEIKKSPNFYKYFPMGDENNGFGFIIHCDSFSNEANRRKLQHDEINNNLFPELAKFIVNKLKKHRNNIDENHTRNRFLNLYVALLLSDIPDKQNNIWLRPVFYDKILEFLKTNIPTKDGYSDNTTNVKINKLKINLNLSDFGLGHIQWFEWDNETEQLLIDEAEKEEKLGIKSWDIRDIVENADLESINNWIANCEEQTYNAFLDELENSYLREKTKEKICQIKLFKFSNGEYYSFNEVVTAKDSYGRTSFRYTNLFINNAKIKKITTELGKLEFVISECCDSKYPKIFSSVTLPEDKKIYEKVAEKCKTNTLSPQEKKNLFLNFTNEETKFAEIAKGHIKDLCLFSDNNGEIKPLNELLNSTLNIPDWLRSYAIKSDEYFAELQSFLISEEEIYNKIILEDWNNIIVEISNVPEFYQKVKFYYDQDEDNPPLKKQAFVYIDENDRFVPQSEVFFNSKMLDLDNQYIDFQSAVQEMLDVSTPNKQVLKFLNSEPFKVEKSDIFDRSINDDTELSFEEIKTILTFCKNNNEQFFENAVIEKQGNSYFVSRKSKNVYQVRPSGKEVKEFLEQNLADNFKILPYELDEDCKNESGIIQKEELYDLILDNIDIDDFKGELIDIISYDEPKRKFLLGLSEIRFVENETYNEESFEYKVLERACQYLKESDFEDFRNKIIIEHNGYDLSLSVIPPFADKIKIEDTELRLSEILPETYQNSNVLSKIIDDFVDLKLDREKLKSLLGVNEEPEPDKIYELLLNGYSVLQNAQQLAFLLLCDKLFDVNFEKFKVETLDEKSWELKYTYYSKPFSFIGDDYLLKKQYENINELISLPFKIGNSENFIAETPYFTDDEFICPCVKSDLSDEEKVELIDFIYNQWNKNDKKEVLKNIDWSKIGGEEISKLLGFNPKYSVFPNEYACESEQLPDYLIEWIGTDNNKIGFISDFGVWTENSPIVDLRKFWKNGVSFSSNLERETRFDEDETMLFNSFEWLKENEYQLSTNEQYEIFKKVVGVINTNQKNKGDLVMQSEFDFEKLEENSTEWNTPYYETWKETLEDKFEIYLYESKLPNVIKLYEISDYIFYRYEGGDVVIDNNNHIYINQNADIKKALSSLIVEDDNDFTAEDLLLIYQTKETTQTEDDEVEELKSEVERLRQRIAELEGVSSTASYSPTVVSYDDYHDKIKEKSERYLYDFLKDNNTTVKWLNYNETDDCFSESWANHDFEILDSNGNVQHYIDCKGTPQQKRTFYLTDNEWNFFLDCIENGINYQIYRVFNVENQPNHILIDNLWEWIEQGKVVPYLTATETIKGGRVFLTLK
jgi:hypothetical protein